MNAHVHTQFENKINLKIKEICFLGVDKVAH